MENVIVAQITQNINITIVVLLLIIGAIFKHWIKWVDNKYIPVILILIGIVATLVFHLPVASGTLIINYIIEGIASGIAATIVHSKGKDIIQELFDKDKIINNVEEEVDKKVSDELEKLASIDFSNVDEEIRKEMGDTESDEENVDISDAINEVTKD